MNHNEALGYLDRLYRQHSKLEREAMSFQKVMVLLNNEELGHMIGILVGILAGIRRHMIKNEESILTQLAKLEVKNGKVKNDKSYQSEPESS